MYNQVNFGYESTSFPTKIGKLSPHKDHAILHGHAPQIKKPQWQPSH